MNNSTKILEMKDVSVFYDSIQALNNITLEVGEGEVVALIGANGAGKSTLLKSILNIQKPKGNIVFKGKELTKMSTDKIVASGISLIPEGHVIFTSMTVMENLQLGAYHGDNDEKAINNIFEYFPILEERKEQIAGTLSGGEQQMLSIGRGLLSNPDLILVDEPSLGLAPKIVNDIFNILVKLNKEGYTILLSEQNAKKSLEIANRGYVLETGDLVMEGQADELLENEEIREAYLGGKSIDEGGN
ncbi:MAG: ABC transporter ATP-binding protein [Halanaerobiales bacterium]|nr:ABC transporter ATP-binding protein [Halanaerobiales bacterium]